jgi:hypothetical protein
MRKQLTAMQNQLTAMGRQGPRQGSQKLREILVFTVLFALPFAGAFVVEWWAATLLCPIGVIGLVGLNESLGEIRWPITPSRRGAPRPTRIAWRPPSTRPS